MRGRIDKKDWMKWIVLIWNSELAREKMWSRIHLIPLLTAEEDRDLVRRHYADQKMEKELLGRETSPYNSDRYVSIWNWSKGDEADCWIDTYGRPTQSHPTHRNKAQCRIWDQNLGQKRCKKDGMYIFVRSHTTESRSPTHPFLSP